MAFEQLKLSSQLCFRLYSASRLVTQTYNLFLDKLIDSLKDHTKDNFEDEVEEK